MIWRVLGLHGLVGLMGFGVCDLVWGGFAGVWVWFSGWFVYFVGTVVWSSLFCVSVFAVRFSFVWGLYNIDFLLWRRVVV